MGVQAQEERASKTLFMEEMLNLLKDCGRKDYLCNIALQKIEGKHEQE